jgi:hypothetical protein
MHGRKLILAAAAVIALPVAALADGGGLKGDVGVTYSHVIFGGGETAKNSWETYAGVIWALNRDLTKEGVMFRALGSYGRYDYTDNCPGGTCGPTPLLSHDGKQWQGDVMVGYQWVRDRVDIGVYVGVDFMNHRISPVDPFNPVSGNETGFKIAGDIETRSRDMNLPYYFYLDGAYSTAFDTYYVLGRAGLNRGGVIFGVEGWLLGDETGDAQRLGGFVNLERQLRPDLLMELTFSAGYQFVDDDGKLCGSFFGSEGGYAALNVAFKFGDRRAVSLK